MFQFLRILLAVLFLPAAASAQLNPVPWNKPWTAFTPVLSCASGTLTASTPTGSYLKVGKTVFFQMSLLLTTVNTCSAGLNASLPATAKSTIAVLGRETAVAGVSMAGTIGAAGTTVGIVKYDNTFAPANGWTIVIGGVYESQ